MNTFDVFSAPLGVFRLPRPLSLNPPQRARDYNGLRFRGSWDPELRNYGITESGSTYQKSGWLHISRRGGTGAPAPRATRLLEEATSGGYLEG